MLSNSFYFISFIVCWDKELYIIFHIYQRFFRTYVYTLFLHTYTDSQSGYVPYYGSTEDSVYSDNEDSYPTAYNGNNDNIYGTYGTYDTNDNDYDLMFPDKDSATDSPPSKGNTFMPIIPSGDDDEGDNEVRFNEKVVHYLGIITISKNILSTLSNDFLSETTFNYSYIFCSGIRLKTLLEKRIRKGKLDLLIV